MSHVARRPTALLLLLGVLLVRPLIAQEGAKPTPWEFGFHGILLMNSFYNDAEVFNSDGPLFATVPNPTLPQHSIGADVRQTQVVGTGDLAGFAGGSLHGELDVDFYGGQLGNGRTSPLLRIRRVIGEVKWDRASILVGQEAPLISELNPRSLATMGITGFTAAGNLWLWIPQIRAGFDFNGGDGVRIGLDAAALAPNSDTPPGTFTTNPNTAERSGRPMVESRLRARWGDGGEIGVGGHMGWIATPTTELIESRALAVEGNIPLGHLFEFRGEWFIGEAIASLGGGGIGQSFHVDGTALRTRGGWGSLTMMPGKHLELGGGAGYDDPEENASDTLANFKLSNIQYNGRIQWRAQPVVLAFEYRHFATVWGGGIGEVTASHLNLAFGVEF